MITKKFGERIKEIRTSRGYSQEKFALSINMDRTYYASVESGKRNISINNYPVVTTGKPNQVLAEKLVMLKKI